MDHKLHMDRDDSTSNEEIWHHNESPLQGLQKWTSNDKMIMEGIENHCQGINVDRFNKVCMYLGVATMSELLIADLTSVDRRILKGEREEGLPRPSGQYK